MRWPRERLKVAKTVASGCGQLPIGAHGKEGVDGSSPSEGFRFSLAMSLYVGGSGDGMLVKCPRNVHAVDTGLVSARVTIEEV
jgi:hypothetical protein